MEDSLLTSPGSLTSLGLGGTFYLSGQQQLLQNQYYQQLGYGQSITWTNTQMSSLPAAPAAPAKPKLGIERLREEVKTWHGDPLGRHK